MPAPRYRAEDQHPALEFYILTSIDGVFARLRVIPHHVGGMNVHKGYTEDAREVKIIRPASGRILRGSDAPERFRTTIIGCWLPIFAKLASVRYGKKNMLHEILKHHQNSCLLQWNVRDSVDFRHPGTPRAVRRRLELTRTRCAYDLA